MTPFTDYEIKVMDSIASQWWSRDDFDAWYQDRLKKKPKEVEQVAETPVEPVAPLEEWFVWPTRPKEVQIQEDKAKDLVESEQWLRGFATETWEALGKRWEKFKEIFSKLGEKSVTRSKSTQQKIREWKLWEAFLENIKWEFNTLGSSFQAVWQTVASWVDVVWEWLENTLQEATPEVVEDALESAMAKIWNNKTVQSIAKSYMDFRERKPESARNIEAVVNIGQILPVTKWWRGVLSEIAKSPVTVPTKITAWTIRKITPKSIAKNIAWIDDITENVLKDTTKSELNTVMKVADNAVKDITNPTPFAKAWEKATQALDKLKVQKNLAWKAKWDALKEVANKTVDTKVIIDKFDDLLADRFNLKVAWDWSLVWLTGKIPKSAKELQPFVNALNELRTAPKGKITLENLDAVVDNLQASLNQAKLGRLWAQLTTAEKTINSFLEWDINRILKETAWQKFTKANLDFKKALDVVTDLEKLLWPKQTRAEWLFKSIFSPQTWERAKQLFKIIKDETWIDLAKESVLAKFAMEAVWDTRGLNLLESTIQWQALWVINPWLIQKSLQTIFSPAKIAKSLTKKTTISDILKSISSKVTKKKK